MKTQSGFPNGELYLELAKQIREGWIQWSDRVPYLTPPVADLTFADCAALVFGRGMRPSYIADGEWRAARALAAGARFGIRASGKLTLDGPWESLDDAADFLRHEVGAATARVVAV